MLLLLLVNDRDQCTVLTCDGVSFEKRLYQHPKSQNPGTVRDPGTKDLRVKACSSSSGCVLAVTPYLIVYTGECVTTHRRLWVSFYLSPISQGGDRASFPQAQNLGESRYRSWGGRV